MRLILGVSLRAVKGFTCAEVVEVFTRGRELFWLGGPSPELFYMLWSLNLQYQFSGEVQSSLQISDLLLHMGDRLGLSEAMAVLPSTCPKGDIVTIRNSRPSVWETSALNEKN